MANTGSEKPAENSQKTNSDRYDASGALPLDQAVWKQFVEASTLEEAAQPWLEILCRMVPDVLRGVLSLGPPDTGPFVPAADWPKGKGGTPGLVVAMEKGTEERRPVVRTGKAEGEPSADYERTCEIAFPFLIDKRLCGVVGLELVRRSEAQLRGVMRLLQWGSAWIEAFYRRGEASATSPESKEGLVCALEAVATSLENPGFRLAATATVTDLATRLRCDRVSIGFLKRQRIHVEALSHSSQFGKKANLIRSIGQVMDEAVEQRTTIVYPEPQGSGARATRTHGAHAKQYGTENICTVPLTEGRRIVGALTFERSGVEAFSAEEVELCENVAAMIGPILEAKRRDDRLILVKVWESLKNQVVRLFGAGHLGLKLATAIAVILLCFLTFTKWMHRVSATASLEGAIHRVAVAPMDGYIAEAGPRAGDVVREEELLCALEDKDMKLERLKWVGEREQLSKQYREALAAHDRARIRVLKAQIDQAEAQIHLLDEQLARTRIRAPFNGVIVTGDLSRSLGSPVTKGSPFFLQQPS